jgi:hypothetical protein
MSMVSEGPESCCRPGDVTVTKIHTGYLVGRALEQLGPGPWWEYILIVNTLEEARRIAQAMALANNVRAWLHMSGDTYEPL